MKKQDKVEIINKLANNLKEAKSTVFVNFAGMDVKSQQELKKNLRESGAKMTVIKNTLIKLAAEQAKYPQEVGEESVLTGQTAVVWSTEDALTPVQILGKYFTQNEKPEFKAGVVDGKFAKKEDLLKLSRLPSREVLYAQVVGSMSAPMYALVGTLQGNLQKLLFILEQRKMGLGGDK